jgi:hypothetical protein
MIYVGYPVELKEACRLLKLDYDDDYDKYSLQIKKINNLLNTYGIELIQQDKGLLIIGVKFHEMIGSIWHQNSTCDEAMILLIETKEKVSRAVREAGIDISVIHISHMEGEEIEMYYPQPLFIHCPFDY